MRVCCICGKPYEGHGNNANPVDWGNCCDLCNVTVVIPRRLLDAKKDAAQPVIIGVDLAKGTDHTAPAPATPDKGGGK